MKKAIAFDPNFKNRGKGRRRGKVSVDTDARNLTGSLTFYSTPEIPEGGYVIISDGNTAKGIAEGSAKPVFWTATDDTVVDIVNGLPNNSDKVYTTAEALDYLHSNDYFILTSDEEEIVTDGLVLELDASKRSSFIDNEPLTNVARVDTWSSTWNNSGTATWNSNDTTVPRLFPDITVQSMRKDTNGNSHLGVGYVTSQIAEGVECTFSLFVYIPSSNSAGMSGAAPYMRPFPANYNATYLKYNGSTSWGSWPRDQWIRVEGTATPAEYNGKGVSTAYISSYLNTAGDKIYYTAPQFELGSKATAFVSGSRAQNTTWYDLSGNGSNATFNNGVQNTFESNKGFTFDGVDDYAQISGLTINAQDNKSYEALIKLSSGFNAQGSIIAGRRSSTNAFDVYSDKRLRGSEDDSGILSNTYLDVDKWYHVAYTFELNNTTAYTQSLYINGELDATGKANNYSDTYSESTSYIGYDARFSQHFDGSINSVKVYSKTLSTNEVSQNYYGGPIVTDGLVFATDAGNLVSYESGSTTTYSMTGSCSGSLNNGTGYSNLNGGTFVFDGTDDYISTEPFDMGTPTDITLECWIKFDETLDSNDRKVMHYDKTGSTNAVFQLRKGTDNSRLMYQAHNGSQWYTMTDTDAIESDTWAHFIITHAGTSAVMYKNGIQAATATMGNLDWTNANNLLIGYRAASEYWKGNIAIMRIYDKKLSVSEVGQNFEAQRARFGL